MVHIKTFKDFFLERQEYNETNVKEKSELLGKVFYHGTVLETWRNEEKSYLFVSDSITHAEYHAISRAEGMIHSPDTNYEGKERGFTSIIYSIVIDEDILNLEWVVDDDDGSRPFYTWQDSYNDVGTFVIMEIDSSKLKEVFKEKITKETPIRYL